MKIFVITLIVFGLVNSYFVPIANAQEVVSSNGVSLCYVGEGNSQSARLLDMNFESYMDARHYQMYKAAQYSCKNIQALRVGVAAVVLTLSIGSIYATVSGVGIPVSAGIQLTNASLGFFSFMIGQMDCAEDKEEYKEKVKDAICEILNKDPNVTCDPSMIKMTEHGDIKNMCKKSSEGEFF